MPSMTFAALINEIREETGNESQEEMTNHASIENDNVMFTLIDRQESAPCTIVYCCDFGALPPAPDREESLQRLLEVNMMMCGNGSPTFALNPENGNAVLIGESDLKHTDGASMLNAFIKYAEQANQWRGDYFLCDADARKNSAPETIA